MSLMQASIYDLWVLRDTDGNMFGQEGAQSKYSAARLAAGLPFPVTSCWNGMVVMPAQPFRQGLRFRHASDIPLFNSTNSDPKAAC